jgi:diguanylate cyclase (GGDEF)-like protein
MISTAARRTLRLRRVPIASGVFGLVALLVLKLGLADVSAGLSTDTRLMVEASGFILLCMVAGAFLASWMRERSSRREVRIRVRRERRARALALRDPLTGLFNRRGLEALVRSPAEPELRRWLFVADLDDFKSVNDRFGHAIGDAVLRLFAERLVELGQTMPVKAARLGGDEFVVVADVRDDAAVAELHAAIAAPVRIPRQGEAETGWVGVSIGMAQWEGATSLERICEQADRSMYASKQSGHLARRAITPDSAGRRTTMPRLFEGDLSLETSAPAAQLCAVAIGIERFKTVKRTLGYGTAGKLVRAVRERIEADAGVRVELIGNQTLAFLIVAETIGCAAAQVERMIATLAEPYRLDGVSIDTPVTVGIAGPSSLAVIRETVEQAQFALDDARQSGRAMVLFDLSAQRKLMQNIRLMTDMQEAIAEGQLALHYQPKMLARDGEIDSVEALVRWSHPDRGMIPPSDFIPVAEQSGDIRLLTWWVLERAYADAAVLAAHGVARPIFVNISAHLIGDPIFADRLIDFLKDQQGRIGIEITETAVLDNPDRALGTLGRLADAGIHIAIDDYGAGLSSLTYLKQLPAHELKIDMSFIRDLGDSNRDPMIVRSTIDLAHGLGLRVTAEGVDTAEALALLRIMGCDLIQGYQVAAAMPIGELTRFLEREPLQDP